MNKALQLYLESSFPPPQHCLFNYRESNSSTIREKYMVTLVKICPLLCSARAIKPSLVCSCPWLPPELASFPHFHILPKWLSLGSLQHTLSQNVYWVHLIRRIQPLPTLQNYVHTTITSRWQCSDVKNWVFIKRDLLLIVLLLIMLLYMEPKLFFRNYINGNTRAFLSLVIMTGVHTHFFRLSIVKSIPGRYWEPIWPLTHSKIKCQFPNAILRNSSTTASY